MVPLPHGWQQSDVWVHPGVKKGMQVETHAHAPAASGDGSQVAPAGQTPPHVPVASGPQGRAHMAAGPGQHSGAPAAERQMQPCVQVPSTQ
jgi:hypothetical protein